MRKVLIIEDDNKIRVLYKRLLEKKFRLEVFEASDGRVGLEMYRSIRPNLIFLDILMPNMNGIEFMEELRQTDDQTPVVIMTAMADSDFVKKMVLLGIKDYVIKSEFVYQIEGRIADILYANIPALERISTKKAVPDYL